MPTEAPVAPPAATPATAAAPSPNAAKQSINLTAEKVSLSPATVESKPAPAGTKSQKQASIDTLMSKYGSTKSQSELRQQPNPPDKPMQPGEENAKPQVPGKSQNNGEESLAKISNKAKADEMDLDGDEAETDEQPKAETEDKDQPADKETQEEAKLGKDGKKKPTGWQVAEMYKGKTKALMARVAELETNPESHPQYKAITEKAKAMEAKLAEYEEELRYVAYQKHPEFIEKYQKPYNEAWARATSGLKGLHLHQANPDTGEVISREINSDDIAALASMDQSKARLHIRTMFPDAMDAQEVRGHVDKIRDLIADQNKALNDHRKAAGEREQARMDEISKASKAFSDEVTKTYQESINLAAQKYEYLRPVEGDAEHNAALEKATKMVDDALKVRPDPKMSAEERAKIVKQHVAIRNRAIAFSTLKHKNARLEAKVAELEKSLTGYRKSEPSAGEATRNGSKSEITGMTYREQAEARLRSGAYRR